MWVCPQLVLRVQVRVSENRYVCTDTRGIGPKKAYVCADGCMHERAYVGAHGCVDEWVHVLGRCAQMCADVYACIRPGLVCVRGCMGCAQAERRCGWMHISKIECVGAHVCAWMIMDAQVCVQT